MSRSSNDDRSDSMNPNNDAYSASEDNHRNQIGEFDDDDDESNNWATTAPVCVKHLDNSFFEQRNNSNSDRDHNMFNASNSMITQPKILEGIRIVYINCKQIERTEKVETFDIDMTIAETQRLWEAGNLVFICLYDQEKVLFEASSILDLSDDSVELLMILEKIDRHHKSALSLLDNSRRSLMSFSETDRSGVVREILQLGGYGAAVKVLSDDRADVIFKLEKNGVDTTSISMDSIIGSSKNCAKVKACARWIKQFHLGKVKPEPMSEAFSRPMKIAQIAKLMNLV
jgi:hypothetical protein